MALGLFVPELELPVELVEALDELLLEALVLEVPEELLLEVLDEVEEELELLLEEPSEPMQAESMSVRPAIMNDLVVGRLVGAPKVFLNMFSPIGKKY